MRTSRTPENSAPASPPSYVERVNRAIDRIVAHLAEPLDLLSLARAAHLSPFHFHRIFQALVGETPADFVKRLRLERALAMMAHGRSRSSGSARRSLTEIALACGFSSSSDFSRCFRQRYGTAPSRFDLAAWRREHRAALEALLPGADSPSPPYLDRLPDGPGDSAGASDDFHVVLRELPARTVAYIRVHDPYQPDAVPQATARLLDWAERHGCADGAWLGYQWDNPELVPLEQCVYHVAVEAADFTPAGEIGRFHFPPMLVAEVEVRGGIDLELRALQWLYGSWLPRSRYVPDDHPGFEAWIGRPFAHGFEYFELFAQLPVRPA